MTIQVTGKNIDVGASFQAYVTDRIAEALDKYIGPEISGHVRVEKVRGRFRTNCSVRLRTGLLLESHGDGADAYRSADVALERLEKRLRRYKRRLKGHHSNHAPVLPETLVNDYVLQAGDDEDTSEQAPERPVVVAETERSMCELSVSEAVMQLDLTEDAFLVFRNAGSGAVNVVYRRADGNIGWIDPSGAGSADPGPETGADGAVPSARK
jgi:ribosomal subunit interface protein